MSPKELGNEKSFENLMKWIERNINKNIYKNGRKYPKFPLIYPKIIENLGK